VNGQKVPAGALGWVIEEMIAFRGYSSAEKFAESFDPPRLSGQAVRRIRDGEDPQIGTSDGNLKLTRLSGMFGLPPATLRLVHAGDVAALEQLPFDMEGGADLRAFILATMRGHAGPQPRRRRANG
jgi:hypothetical protein